MISETSPILLRAKELGSIEFDKEFYLTKKSHRLICQAFAEFETCPLLREKFDLLLNPRLFSNLGVVFVVQTDSDVQFICKKYDAPLQKLFATDNISFIIDKYMFQHWLHVVGVSSNFTNIIDVNLAKVMLQKLKEKHGSLVGALKDIRYSEIRSAEVANLLNSYVPITFIPEQWVDALKYKNYYMFERMSKLMDHKVTLAETKIYDYEYEELFAGIATLPDQLFHYVEHIVLQFDDKERALYRREIYKAKSMMQIGMLHKMLGETKRDFLYDPCIALTGDLTIIPADFVFEDYAYDHIYNVPCDFVEFYLERVRVFSYEFILLLGRCPDQDKVLELVKRYKSKYIPYGMWSPSIDECDDSSAYFRPFKGILHKAVKTHIIPLCDDLLIFMADHDLLDDDVELFKHYTIPSWKCQLFGILLRQHYYAIVTYMYNNQESESLIEYVSSLYMDDEYIPDLLKCDILIDNLALDHVIKQIIRYDWSDAYYKHKNQLSPLLKESHIIETIQFHSLGMFKVLVKKFGILELHINLIRYYNVSSFIAYLIEVGKWPNNTPTSNKIEPFECKE